MYLRNLYLMDVEEIHILENKTENNGAKP